jgi:hypothetical protein
VRVGSGSGNWLPGGVGNVQVPTENGRRSAMAGLYRRSGSGCAEPQGWEFEALGVDSGAWRSGYEQQPPTGP